MKRLILTLALTSTLALTCIHTAFAKTSACIDWGLLMTKFDIENSPKGYRTVLLQSFENYTRLAGDEWLTVGIPYILAEYLSAGKNITVLYGPIAKYHPASASPNYVVGGMYQHTGDMIRVFVKLMESGKLTQQYQLNISYPQNAQFFDVLKDTALSILAIASPPYEKERLQAIQTETSTVPAYENYIRGLISLWSYNPDQMDVTKTWFEESKKADIHYFRAYKGLIDMYTFLAMYNKQNRGAFSQYFQSAEKELMLWERFKKRPPPPKRTKKHVIKMREYPYELRNRYLLGNAAFIAGLHAADKQDWAEAGRLLEEALVHVPEDAITWNHLAKIYDNAGDAGRAAQARAKAYELNRCLQ